MYASEATADEMRKTDDAKSSTVKSVSGRSMVVENFGPFSIEK
jgi:hypothetical protein